MFSGYAYDKDAADAQDAEDRMWARMSPEERIKLQEERAKSAAEARQRAIEKEARPAAEAQAESNRLHKLYSNARMTLLGLFDTIEEKTIHTIPEAQHPIIRDFIGKGRDLITMMDDELESTNRGYRATITQFTQFINASVKKLKKDPDNIFIYSTNSLINHLNPTKCDKICSAIQMFVGALLTVSVLFSYWGPGIVKSGHRMFTGHQSKKVESFRQSALQVANVDIDFNKIEPGQRDLYADVYFKRALFNPNKRRRL